MQAGDIFTKSDIKRLTRRSDLRGAWAIAANWAVIAFAFALVARWPNPLSVVVALCLIAGRQLALGILQHEGAHQTLFESRWGNLVATDWLCARPIWQNLEKYRIHHLKHHADAGSDADPDISLHRDYPITRASLRRKFLRDLFGITGVKTIFGLLLMDAEIIRWTVSNDIVRLPRKGRVIPTALRNMAPMLLTNAVLFGLLWAAGHPALYALWWLAFITPLPLFMRIRSIAEHGCLERIDDVFKNTRTTRAGWLAKLTVAPIAVHYHLEHHLLPGVPYYRLKDLHQLLRAKRLSDEPPGYWQVLRQASALGS